MGMAYLAFNAKRNICILHRKSQFLVINDKIGPPLPHSTVLVIEGVSNLAMFTEKKSSKLQLFIFLF